MNWQLTYCPVPSTHDAVAVEYRTTVTVYSGAVTCTSTACSPPSSVLMMTVDCGVRVAVAVGVAVTTLTKTGIAVPFIIVVVTGRGVAVAVGVTVGGVGVLVPRPAMAAVGWVRKTTTPTNKTKMTSTIFRIVTLLFLNVQMLVLLTSKVIHHPVAAPRDGPCFSS